MAATDEWQAVVDALREIPGALGERASEAPMPRWWKGPRIDNGPRILQISGPVQDVNSSDRSLLDGPLPDYSPERPTRVIGAWKRDLPDASGPPEGWNTQGVETLAWYSSFHYCRYAWGIFIRSSGVERVASALVASGHGSLDGAFRDSWEFLYEHELTHYAVDILATGVELASEKAIFLPGRTQQHKEPALGLAEEALATAIARRALPVAHRSALDNWLKAAPAGYRDFAQHPMSRRAESWREVIGNLSANRGPLPIFWTPERQRPPMETEVPVFLVIDSDITAKGLSQALVGPIRPVETDQFVRDLNRLSRGAPRTRHMWEKCKKKLAAGNLVGGSRLECVDARRNQYSVRINRELRAGLIHESDRWLAVAIDRHDDLYARLRRMENAVATQRT